MTEYYIGLLRADGTEPPKESDYARVPMGDVDVWDIAKAATTERHIFPDVPEPGWGEIPAYAVYDAPEGGEKLLEWQLPKPTNCHAGTIPLIHEGRLLLGVDVSANIKLHTVAAMEV